ncbi:hypothetical protein HII36_09935 [Nonomuraea sp. NN258]|uniref:DUF6493 family protein n=1 Tax=Nonomuraea antri TaxID=2730852 RepID=UPI0015694D56|nr:DUF6493 family protein [Nonomuraea antri]NRQ32152.1 hypothetical protein [Nonomuraea antri]
MNPEEPAPDGADGPERDGDGASGAGRGRAALREVDAWEFVREAVRAGDATAVADRVAALDPAARRAVARDLPTRIPEVRAWASEQARLAELRLDREREAAWARDRHLFADDKWLWSVKWDPGWKVPGPDDWVTPMRVAGAATIGGAAAVLAWLTRRDLVRSWWPPVDDGDVLERVLAGRSPEWQADFAVRAALRLRVQRAARPDPLPTLALAMLRRSGATPPGHDPLTVAWVRRPPTAASLRADPLLDHLLTRLFEAEGVGHELRAEQAGSPASGPWLAALRTLERDGRIARDLLLDGCVRRFLRGGTATTLRFFARLHDLLEPTADEVAARQRDYLRLLPAAPGPVADLALRHLRAHGGLEPAEVVEAVQALLYRPERKLVSAGLSWLDQAAGAAGDDLDELAPALGFAFAGESPDVQGRAVRLAIKHARRFTPVGAQAVREAIGLLPPDLGAALAAVFGGEAAREERPAPDDFTPVPLPAPRRAEPMAPVPRLVGRLPDDGGWDVAERWLAAVVRACAGDRDGLRARMAEIVPLNRYQAATAERLYLLDTWTDPRHWAEAIRREIVQPGGEPEPATAAGTRAPDETTGAAPGESAEIPAASPAEAGVRVSRPVRLRTLRKGLTDVNPAEHHADHTLTFVPYPAPEPERPPADRLPRRRSAAPPHLFLLRRWQEVYAGLKAGTLPPYLLAEPTSGTGHVDPGELVARLAGYERAGVEAMPADLQQALLRLPRTIPPEAAARAGTLTSAAGRALASWLNGGRPEPVTRVEWSDESHVYVHDQEPGVAESPRLTPHVSVEPTGLELIDALLSGAPAHRHDEHGPMGWWHAVLPSDREVVAQHYLPYLLHQWDHAGIHPSYGAALAPADGPTGEAYALMLAYFLATRRSWEQPPGEAVRLLLDLAARGELPAEEVGRNLALLLRRTWFKLGPVLESLESAAEHGAHLEVWRIMCGLLAAYLPGPGERPIPGHTRALDFALRAARWAGAARPVPCVAEIAGRKASSNFVRAARRLHTSLM